MKTSPKKPARQKTAPAAPGTFTVRDMNRQPRVLLVAAQKFGRVIIRSRSAGNFILTPEVPAPNERVREAEAFMERQRAYRERLRLMGFVPPSKEDSERIARAIAGDDF